MGQPRFKVGGAIQQSLQSKQGQGVVPLQRAYSSKGGKRTKEVAPSGTDGNVKFQVQGPKRGSSSITEQNEEPEKPMFSQD